MLVLVVLYFGWCEYAIVAVYVFERFLIGAVRIVVRNAWNMRYGVIGILGFSCSLVFVCLN